ncbi:MAG TPA: hypothetical protein VN636_07125 [Acidimicrobiia bacterium]|nr:hypothetical protein [Acidimicrobiia bacterium]
MLDVDDDTVLDDELDDDDTVDGATVVDVVVIGGAGTIVWNAKAAMATIGAGRFRPLRLPRKGLFEKSKTPPSVPTIK